MRSLVLDLSPSLCSPSLLDGSALGKVSHGGTMRGQQLRAYA